ncbi:MAG: flagellar biosynthetic protein FliR [Lachnospiraceae bacterium]|nr:flagellar biosynthetic protein FliR [Candidatus Colinaster scatohippi]
MLNYSFDLNNLEYFLCILIRITMFIFTAPFFSQSGVPRQYKVGFSIFLSGLMYGVIGEHPDLQYMTVWGYAVIVLKEALTGLVIGYSTSICNTIIDFAGRIIDMESGLSMVNLVDPATRQQSSVSGVIYQYGVLLMLFLSGMHRYLLKALAETFELVPVNGAIINTDRLLESCVSFMGDYIAIGFRICLPVFGVMILLNAVLGIMARVAPQMNMFSVGMQIKVLVGLCILFFTIGMLPSVSNLIYSEMKTMMASFVNTML